MIDWDELYWITVQEKKNDIKHTRLVLWKGVPEALHEGLKKSTVFSWEDGLVKLDNVSYIYQ